MEKNPIARSNPAHANDQQSFPTSIAPLSGRRAGGRQGDADRLELIDATFEEGESDAIAAGEQ